MLQNNTPEEGQTGTPPVKDDKKFLGVADATLEAAKAAGNFVDTWKEIDRLSAEFVKTTGMGRERTIEMETSITQSATELLKFSKGIYTYEQALARSSKIIDEIAKNTSRSLIGNAKEVEGIAVAMEATNVPSAKLVANFKQAGFALESIPKEMEKVANYTRSIGVNTAQVSLMVVDNLKNLNLYNFQNGVEGLTKMAAQSALFGVDMKGVLTMSEKLFDPEQAINMAASLQRLGVSTSALLDPLKLMDMGQNNPAELQNQLVEMTKQFAYFDENNQKFQILPGAQRQMREISKELGIGVDELARMALGSSELNKKMSEIRFPTLTTGPMTEDQKQMIANMSEMRDGQYKVMVEQEDSEGYKTGKTVEKTITELTDKDIEMLSKSGKEKPLEDIAKEQLQALNRIYNALMREAIIPKAAVLGSSLGKAGRSTLYGATSGVANSTEKLLNQKEIQKFLENNTGMMTDIIEKLMKGESPGQADMTKILQTFKNEGGKMGSTDDFIQNFNETINTSLGKMRAINTPTNNNSQLQQTPQQQTPQLQQIQAPQEIEEPDSSGSAMSINDVTALVSKMTPDINMLAKQIEGGNKTEINESLAKIGVQLGKSGMNEESIGKLAEHIMPKLTDEQIKTITSASSGMLSNQSQPKEQPKEQTGVANMIKPEEIKGLVTEMMPDSKDYANQIKSNDTAGAEKIGKGIESQLSKLDNGDKTIKTLTDRMEDDSKFTKEQIKSIANTGKIKEKTQTQTIVQPKEQTGIASMIKPEEIKGLVTEMMPDPKDYVNQIKTNDKVGEEKTGKDNEPQLSKFGIDDKTMKVFADTNVAKIKVSEDQIKSMITSTKNAIEQNETQQPQIAQQTQPQTQEPKSVALAMAPKDIDELSNKMRPDFNKLYEQMNNGGNEAEISSTLSKIGERLGKSGMDDKTMKEFTDTLGKNAELSQTQIKTLTDATKVTDKNETQQTQTIDQPKEQTGIASMIKPEEIKGLVTEMMPDPKDYANQIKSNDTAGAEKIGRDIESQLSKLDNGDKIMKSFTNMISDSTTLTNSQIKTLANTTKTTEKNETQQLPTIEQPKEQTGIASMIKPEEIKGLVTQMMPDFKNLAQQIESGDEKGAEKTGKDIELQLSKFGMDDKTMKMFTDIISESTTLTDSQIKTLANTTNTTKTTEKNETQKPQIAQQPQTQSQTEGPKLSFMKQIDAFDKVTQGIAGEKQTITNSQVNDLNNQTVTATNNNQQQTNQSDYLIDRISQAQAQAQTQIVEHKFDGTITIKVDAPPGVDSAYVTKTINDMVNSPAFTDKMIKSQEVMANNYGLTGGKVGAYNNTSGVGMA
jgi:hypothetical protein